MEKVKFEKIKRKSLLACAILFSFSGVANAELYIQPSGVGLNALNRQINADQQATDIQLNQNKYAAINTTGHYSQQVGAPSGSGSTAKTSTSKTTVANTKTVTTTYLYEDYASDPNKQILTKTVKDAKGNILEKTTTLVPRGTNESDLYKMNAAIGSTGTVVQNTQLRPAPQSVPNQQAAQTVQAGNMPNGNTKSSPVPVPVQAPVTATPTKTVQYAQPISTTAAPMQVAPATNVDGAMKAATVGSYGTNIPLEVAIKANSPSNYSVSIAPDVKGQKVTWKTDKNDWQSAISAIASQNGLSYYINSNDHRIGFSGKDNVSQAKSLSDAGSKIWTLQSGISLKKNLEAWAKSIGWSVHWSDRLYQGYLTQYKATFVGTFVDQNGKDGVVTQVLQSLVDSNAEVPLEALFYTKNKVLVIREADYDQEKVNDNLVPKTRDYADDHAKE